MGGGGRNQKRHFQAHNELWGRHGCAVVPDKAADVVRQITKLLVVTGWFLAGSSLRLVALAGQWLCKYNSSHAHVGSRSDQGLILVLADGVVKKGWETRVQ